MSNLAAVTGVGMSARFSARIKKSIAGLVREAALNALEDAGCTWEDIDAVITALKQLVMTFPKRVDTFVENVQH